MRPVLLDTGIIYALFDKRDRWHGEAKKLLTGDGNEFLIPVTTLPEVAYLLETRFKEPVSGRLVDWVVQQRLAVEALLPQDMRRMSHLMTTYPSLGFVDASVVAIAERVFVETIATTDRRHFAPIRPSHVEQFTLVP